MWLSLVLVASFSALGPAHAASPPVPTSPPVFTNLTPNGGETLVGGQTFTVGWRVSHDSDTSLSATISLSIDGGASYLFLTAGTFATGFATYPWPVPLINVTTARVQVCATARDGGSSCIASMSDFRITASGSYLSLVSPADGAMDVPLALTLVISASGVDISTVTWMITPTVGAFVPVWTNNNSLLWMAHTVPFAACTRYSITLQARDLFGGTVGPYTWTFTTICSSPYIVSTDPADGAVNVSLSQDIVVVFSGAMNPNTVTWTIVPTILLIGTWPDPTTLVLLHNASFASCTTYSVAVDGRDVNGNPLVPGPVPNPWSFTTTCPGQGTVVQLLVPAGGEVWTGGSLHMIVWNQSWPTGGAMDWALSWSQDGGATWSPIASGTAPPGTVTYDWTVPAVDAMSARVRVCVVYPAPPVCDESGAFVIDSTPPRLVSHSPADGALDVPITTSLVAVFSEGMNTRATEPSFWITPTAFIFSTRWDTGRTTLTIQLDGLRTRTHYYWGFTCGAQDASDPGNALANCQAVHDFWTEGTPSPSLSLISPSGGDSWTGGSTHDVVFSISNPGNASLVLTATVSYRSSAGSGLIGTQDVTVPAGTTVTRQTPWTVPLIDATDVVVNVTATGGNTTLWAESGPLAIDSTPPQVLLATPNGTNVPLDPLLVVRFSEPMNVLLGPVPPLTIAPGVGAMAFVWGPAGDGLTAPLTGTQPCTAYVVTIGDLRDGSDPGNPVVPYSWTFTTVCSPTVDLLVPDGGQDWTGGSAHLVEWTSGDADDSFLVGDLWYSADGGTTYAGVIATDLVIPVGAGSFLWTLPRIDSVNVRVRIEVTDSAGNTARDDSVADLTIDSTPPAILASFPSDGASGFKTTREIWFVFTERVDRASFQSAFSIAPNPGGLTFAWSLSNLDTDVLTVDHAPFKSNTAYAVTFGTAARDDSDPGNFVPSPLRVRFSTQPPPNVNPPVAKAVGKNQVLAGEPVTLDGTGSTGSITSYVWRIVDNQGHFVAVLVGPVATYTFRNHGRHSVTLIVTDQNRLTDEDTIEIAVTSNRSANDLILAGGALLAAALLIGSTEAGRLSVFAWILFPLYVRRKRNEILEHQTRGMILGYIMVHPGDTYTDIKRNLMLSNGTLSYHLTVMEREGIVRSQTRGTRKLFFPEGVRVPEDGGGLHEVQVRMYRAIAAVPGLAVKDIAGALGITSQHALYHLRALAAQGYVRLERRGFSLRCYAEPGKGPALHGETDGENG